MGEVPNIKDRLKVGEILETNNSIKSPNGKYNLVLQDYGNFVVYAPGGRLHRLANAALNCSHGQEVDREGSMATFADQHLQWSSRTRYRRNGGDVVLMLQDDGVAVLKLDGIVIWSTNGALVKPYEPRDFEPVTSGDKLCPGQCLAVGQSITSKSGKFSATLQDNGQFILTVGYDDGITLWGPGGTKIWQFTPNLSDRDAYMSKEEFFDRATPGSMVLGDTGGLNLYSASWPNRPVWTSGVTFPGFAGTVSELKPGETLVIGQNMRSHNGDHELSLLPSGNLRIRNTRFNSNAYYFTVPDSKIQDVRGNDGDVPWSIGSLPSGPAPTQTSVGDALRPGTTLGLDDGRRQLLRRIWRQRQIAEQHWRSIRTGRCCAYRAGRWEHVHLCWWEADFFDRDSRWMAEHRLTCLCIFNTTMK
ncbi:hypothetical protein B0T10DRAFT_587153 [Thelonectria olida]|uniref:Bulb-type lectin domain-containing protein n=1 Tax=Thelonectria olida TaxID=1576542 RepID=A0A9P8WEK4_9HYPO|nr:hypothetical protein B0T10DRAFT_587153 [Thelonectria olida]